MADLKVSFPEPCSEPWDGMEQHGCSRHCASCKTIVHDLELLTIEETERLLAISTKVCVRARVRADGTVATKKRSGTSRRMIAAVGASLSLAAAACQTASDEANPGRYTVSGELAPGLWFFEGELRASNGWKTPVRRDETSRQFRATNLHPGVYTLVLDTGCGHSQTFEDIVVRDGNVDLGTLDWQVDCIVVGQIMREDDENAG